MIKINPNCKNGEHTFIAAVTHIDGRDHVVSCLVCQHCLYYVNEETWFNHLKDNFSSEPKQTVAAAATDIKPVPDVINGTINKRPTQTYPGKKRGPKPKIQGKVQGLGI
jgi:hypothetical protein